MVLVHFVKPEPVGFVRVELTGLEQEIEVFWFNLNCIFVKSILYKQSKNNVLVGETQEVFDY